MTKAEITRCMRLLDCIHAGGKGSARFQETVYKLAMSAGWLAYESPIEGGRGYSLTEPGVRRWKIWKGYPVEVDCLAVKGLVGWHVEGRCGADTTYSKGPYDAPPPGVTAIDMSGVYTHDGVGASASKIWARPNLALGLPDGNVRNLFEGCIGNEGTTSGHPWDGDLGSLKSLDSVGLSVYVAVLLAAGGVMVHE